MSIKDRPDLIVSDVMMPKISGFDMLDILRSTTETRDIKVIMMTALSSEDQRQRGVALGADRYLVKSQVGIEDVVRTVHEVLGDAPVSTNATVPAPQTTLPPTQPPQTQSTQPSFTATPRPYVTQSAPAQPPVYNPTPQPPAAPLQATQIQPQTTSPTAQQYTAPTPMPTPVTTPVAPVGPSSPPTLPQPTAPFSTTRPASLGDRVIHPLVSAEPAPDFGNLMTQELSGNTLTTSVPNLPTPPPVPQPAATYLQQPAPTSPATEASGLDFEETPLPTISLPPAPGEFSAQDRPPVV